MNLQVIFTVEMPVEAVSMDTGVVVMEQVVIKNQCAITS